jgi:MFS family permease
MVEGASIAADESDTAPTLLSRAVRVRIFFYLGVLIILLGFGVPYGGLMYLPITFLLKNKFHLSSHAVAQFRLISALPLYFSFVFGFIRDTWNPFGIRDRGFLILFGSASAVLYRVFAFTPLNYGALLIAVILLSTAFLFVVSAQTGLTATVARQHVMTGQVSAAWHLFMSLPATIAVLAGGALSDVLEGEKAGVAVRNLFLIGAVVMATLALYGFWRPRSVFGNVEDEGRVAARRLGDLKRLARHWPLYPAMLIWFLWCFGPGYGTPLQFYLQNTLHGNDAAYADWTALFTISITPTLVLFGVLCRKYPLRRLLFWGTVLAVPQLVPLLVLHSVKGALIGAILMGLMGGFGTAAIIDLIIRSAPKGLEGTTFMISAALSSVADRFGDVLGTMLYDHFGGFGTCVVATTLSYLLILPVLSLVPRRLTATMDGSPPEVGFAAD